MPISIGVSFFFDISRIFSTADGENTRWGRPVQYLNFLIFTLIFLTTLVLIRIDDDHVTAIE